MTEDLTPTQPIPAAGDPGEHAAPSADAGDEATRPAPTPPPPPPATSAAPAASAPRRRSTAGAVRSVLVGLAFFLTCLSLVLATTTWWLHDTLLSTDRFVALTAPMARDPQVQDALVEATTTQIDQALDLGPVGQYVATGIAREVYSSDAFARLWERALGAVHAQLVAVLRGDTRLVQTSDGQIVINLYPLLDAVFQRINALKIEIGGRTVTAPTLTDPENADTSRAELSAALGRTLPPTFGVIPIADSTRLENVQRLVSVFDAVVYLLFVVAGLLAVLTIALARRRLRIVALLGLGSLASLLIARLIVSSAADGLTTAVIGAGPGAIIGGEAVQLVADSYRAFAQVVLLLALVAAVAATAAAWLLERRAPGGTGTGARSLAGDEWLLALAGLCVALGALLLVGLTAATLVVAALAYVAWLVVVVRWHRRSGGELAAEPAAG